MENSLQSAHALKYQDFNMSSSLRIVHHGLSPISDLFFHRQGTKQVLVDVLDTNTATQGKNSEQHL